jgi:hypothetical protein
MTAGSVDDDVDAAERGDRLGKSLVTSRSSATSARMVTALPLSARIASTAVPAAS